LTNRLSGLFPSPRRKGAPIGGKTDEPREALRDLVVALSDLEIADNRIALLRYSVNLFKAGHYHNADYRQLAHAFSFLRPDFTATVATWQGSPAFGISTLLKVHRLFLFLLCRLRIPMGAKNFLLERDQDVS
jgi:hypothetical protein